VINQGARDGNRNELQYDNEFWRFSLAVYKPADVAAECLALQEAIGLDVNLLLFCAWLGTRAIVLSRGDIEAACRVVASWHASVVRPLRGVRRHIKTQYGDAFEGFRSRVKDDELQAEQIEQAMLFAYAQGIQTSQDGSDHRDAVARNVNAYLSMMSGATAPVPAAPLLVRAAQLSAK
jgi:uncharacterized protein (TIGR02444 family)